MDELMPLIRGKVNQIALQHDAPRVAQAAIQFGAPPERLEITQEVQNFLSVNGEMNEGDMVSAAAASCIPPQQRAW